MLFGEDQYGCESHTWSAHLWKTLRPGNRSVLDLSRGPDDMSEKACVVTLHF